MRYLLPIALSIILSSAALGQEISDPRRTNLLLQNFSPLQLEPGESGFLSFDLFNPYEWAMNGTTLDAEIYSFNDGTGQRQVEDLASPPVFLGNGSTSFHLVIGTLNSGSNTSIELPIQTNLDTARGSFFTQGSYFVRFRLEFDYLLDRHAIMVSPGFFSKEELAYALRDATADERVNYRFVGNANYTYLGERLGVESIDGLIPDTGFGVKDRLPLWPFNLLLAGSATAFLVFLIQLRRESRQDSKPINRGQR